MSKRIGARQSSLLATGIPIWTNTVDSSTISQALSDSEPEMLPDAYRQMQKIKVDCSCLSQLSKVQISREKEMRRLVCCRPLICVAGSAFQCLRVRAGCWKPLARLSSWMRLISDPQQSPFSALMGLETQKSWPCPPAVEPISITAAGTFTQAKRGTDWQMYTLLFSVGPSMYPYRLVLQPLKRKFLRKGPTKEETQLLISQLKQAEKPWEKLLISKVLSDVQKHILRTEQACVFAGQSSPLLLVRGRLIVREKTLVLLQLEVLLSRLLFMSWMSPPEVRQQSLYVT